MYLPADARLFFGGRRTGVDCALRGVCLLTDVPGICAKVSSVCAVSNRISDGMTGVCMTSDGVCVVSAGVSVSSVCIMSAGATDVCVMSAGVTGVCVMPTALPGVACDGGGDSWNSRMTSTALYFVLKLQ